MLELGREVAVVDVVVEMKTDPFCKIIMAIYRGMPISGTRSLST
jgi:hypothetical protein